MHDKNGADSKEWVNLLDYVGSLLSEGKSSAHPDFALLFRIYGKKKIVELAQIHLKKKKEGKRGNV